jgi:hypothetical protein
VLFNNISDGEGDASVHDATNTDAFTNKYLELSTPFYNNTTNTTYEPKTRCLFKRKSTRDNRFIVEINGVAMNVNPDFFFLTDTLYVPSPEND